MNELWNIRGVLYEFFLKLKIKKIFFFSCLIIIKDFYGKFEEKIDFSHFSIL